MRTRVVVAVVLGVLLVPAVALACGAYVTRERTEVAAFNDAIEFAVLRQGTTTFVTVRNEYRGPSEEFAILVPVPALLGADDVETLDRSVFDALQQMTGPVLSYERERDPCEKPGDGRASGSGGYAGGGGGTGASTGSAAVRVEAAFAAGEYDVVVLSAKESASLARWLADNGYKMPAGLPPLLAPYVTAGWKFFVAKVDPARVNLVGGRAALSPLRFRYDAADLTIPVRLATLNSAGEQDVLLYVISETPMEVANRPNVDVPRGAVLNERGRADFARFYQAVFETTLARHPGAAVTEFVGDFGHEDRPVLPPLGGDIDGRYQLTRLHLRVAKSGNVDDLVLRAKQRGSYRAGYVYRTPWSGPTSCASPKRGVWDTEREAYGAGSGTGTGTGTGARSLDPLESGDALPSLEELVTTPIAELGVTPVAPPPKAPPLVPALPPGKPPGGSSSGGGCGCGAASAAGSGVFAMLVLALRNVRRRRDL